MQNETKEYVPNKETNNNNNKHKAPGGGELNEMEVSYLLDKEQ